MMPPKVKKSKKVRSQRMVKLDSLKQINLNTVGLDIGVARIWAENPLRITFYVFLYDSPINFHRVALAIFDIAYLFC